MVGFAFGAAIASTYLVSTIPKTDVFGFFEGGISAFMGSNPSGEVLYSLSVTGGDLDTEAAIADLVVRSTGLAGATRVLEG